MIARYSRPEMSKIWEDRHRFQVWLEVELAVSEELAKEGRIPKKAWADLEKKARALLKAGGVDPKRVEFHEATTRHDVIAFTTAVAEQIGPSARYIHFGLTSSDVVDTALCVLIQQAGAIIRQGIVEILKTLEKQAKRHRDLPCMGRTHGMFAEPSSFGLKFLGWYVEWKRNLERLDSALENMRVGKLSGAVGSNPHWGPDFEEKVLKRLALRREPVSTQVIPRDRHAELLSVFAICGASLERIGIELRHLQRTEVSEVQEGFQKGQKGSSAMPHKRNPISSENVTGCARLLRSYAQASLENVALWHERDISHSSVERVILPDSTLLLDYALARMNTVLDQLVVREDRVRGNLEKAGATVFSGHFLLSLVEKGVTREDAYAWIQQCALASLDAQGTFIERLSEHAQVRKFLSVKQIREIGSLKYQLRHVPQIYQSVFGAKSGKSARTSQKASR